MSAAESPAPSGSFWRRRIREPIVAQFRQGITAEKIALTIALGAVLAVFPILGSTTLLCAIVAASLKLNQPIIQLTSWLVYPMQFVLLLPLYRLGEVFGAPHVTLSIPQMMDRFRAGPWQFIEDFGLVALGGIGAWFLIAPVVAATIYFALRAPLRALAARTRLLPVDQAAR